MDTSSHSAHSLNIPRTYFLGLNALRLYAALAVIFSHVEQNVERHFLGDVTRLFLIDADTAVNLFFVLSGFLITYLLLQESAVTGKIAIRKFYLRRIFRIWPLYYFVAILGLLVFPLIFGSYYTMSIFYPEYPAVTMPIWVKILLAFLLLPNFATITAPMEHLWSIGVEEQFYAWWPWVIQKKLHIVRVCLGVLIIKFVLAPFIYTYYGGGAARIFNEFRFECMAIGALGAYFYCQKVTWLKWVYHPVTQGLVLVAFFLMAGRHMPVNPYVATVTSVVFIVFILNVATNPHSLVKLNHPFFERGGQISYGLYLYHFPILFVMLQFVPRFFTQAPFYSIAVLLGTLVGTWLVAEISYRWYEKPFLNLKERFGSVHTERLESQ